MTRETTELDFYAIELTIRERKDYRDYTLVDRTYYFKADRYSCYGGRLQVEVDEELAQKFKTASGAWKAIDRLLKKKTIKVEHNPRVVRYTRTRVITTEPVVR